MPTKHSDEQVKRFHLSRRRFLASGMTAASAAALGGVINPARGAGASKAAGATPAAAGEPPIDPGYFASQFYDSHEADALRDVIETGSPFRFWGPKTPRRTMSFEDEWAKYIGVKYALGVTSGTTALNCAVTAVGVGPGDEVIVPSYTWWSDYTCVIHAGALPVFAEIDESLCLDPEDFARKITPRTKAVIAVHLLGGPCDVAPIMETARARKIAVIEDCAQCCGGAYRGRKLGSIGDVGIYSFQLNKMISSGEGGAVVTNDPIAYERAVRFHNMGGLHRVFSQRLGQTQVGEFAGENYRMNEFVGAVLGEQLPKLDVMRAGLKRAFNAVLAGIKDLPGIKLRKQPDADGDLGYAVYIEMPSKEKRDRCIAELSKRRIPTGTMSGSVLLPAARSVIEKQTRHPNWPSFTSPEGRAMKYGRECCPKTIGVFDRFVQVRMGPKYTEPMTDRIVAAIREVWSVVA